MMNFNQSKAKLIRWSNHQKSTQSIKTKRQNYDLRIIYEIVDSWEFKKSTFSEADIQDFQRFPNSVKLEREIIYLSFSISEVIVDLPLCQRWIDRFIAQLFTYHARKSY